MSEIPKFSIEYPDCEDCVSFFNGIDKQIDVHEAAMYFGALKRDAEWIRYYGKALSALSSELSRLSRWIDETGIGYGSLFTEFFYKEYQYILLSLFDDVDENALVLPKPCFVYYILNFEKTKVKIGISNNPVSRAKAIQTASGEEIELLHTIQFDSRQDALNAEKFLHDVFSNARKKPSKVAKSSEWFDSRICKVLLKHFYTKEQIQKLEHTNFSIDGISNELRIEEKSA